MKQISNLNNELLKILKYAICIAFTMAVMMSVSIPCTFAQDLGFRTKPKPAFQILQVWKMAPELNEISANVLIDENNMACIQDNKGIIFIYNLLSKTIIARIVFGDDGDYEALARVNHTYYVCRADGKIYEVNVKSKGQPVVDTYTLPFTTKNDIESMFYDQAKNRLLVGVKEQDLTDPTGKGIYSFDLQSKKMNTKPVYMLYPETSGGSGDPDKKGKKQNKNAQALKPSDIALHPTTGDLYVLNGPKSILLVADRHGKTKYTYDLDKKIFPQPEGLCFTPSGELYISSEASKGGTAIIAKVKLE